MLWGEGSLPTLGLPHPTIWMGEVSARDCGPRELKPGPTRGLGSFLAPRDPHPTELAWVWGEGEARLRAWLGAGWLAQVLVWKPALICSPWAGAGIGLALLQQTWAIQA